jgi:hypothetical protein
LRLNDGGQLLSDPRKLAGVGYYHAKESEVFRALVELQNHARDPSNPLISANSGI